MPVAERLVDTAVKTTGERISGGQPSRTRAFATAAAAGIGIGILVYKLLRSGDPGEDDSDDDSGDAEA